MIQVLLACAIAMITTEKKSDEIKKTDYLQGEIQVVD
jgi:hypothetical protein